MKTMHRSNHTSDLAVDNDTLLYCMIVDVSFYFCDCICFDLCLKYFDIFLNFGHVARTTIPLAFGKLKIDES